MLIRAGDEFDEADFNVTHEEHQDEVSIETATSSRDSKRGSTLQNLKDSKVPQLRPHTTRIDSVADEVRQSPSRTGAINSAHAVQPNEARSDRTDPKLPGRPASLQPTTPSLRAPNSASLDPGGLPKYLPEPCHVQERHEPQHRLGDSILPLDKIDAVDHAAPVGFFTARAAETVQNGSSLPLKAPAFNPHLESPSIRKTAGVDHTKTKPVGRDSIPMSPSLLPPRPNFVNPQVDKNRKVGMPAGAASPLQNRNSYRPLQIKRPAELDPAQSVN